MSDTKRKADAIIRRKVDRVMRAGMAEAVTRFMRDTPVDTGRAAYNWNASVDKPDPSSLPDADGASFMELIPQKMSDNMRTARQVRFFDGQVGYVANGVPYIGILEDGGSGQAPTGMVRVNMPIVRRLVRRAATAQGIGALFNG